MLPYLYVHILMASRGDVQYLIYNKTSRPLLIPNLKLVRISDEGPDASLLVSLLCQGKPFS